MRMTRRTAIKLLASALPAFGAGHAFGAAREVFGERRRAPEKHFVGTRESLAAYRVPDWFRDAKFGIWAHWGPQSAPEYGDWYARNIYIQGTSQYKYHLERYGHPSKVGYKDVIATWRGENFDPDYLVSLYKKAGAKYFVTMGAHVDNFDLWNSRHTRWNAVKMGIKKDVVALFRAAALKHGLRFGVSEHLWITYKWLSVARGADTEGPLAGVPYDGADPQYADLYGDCPKVYRQLPWDEEGIPHKWKLHWFERVKDLIDQAQPDFVYCDGHIPFGEIGLSLVAHFYNQNIRTHAGKLQAVYTAKSEDDASQGICVFDKERGVVETDWPYPWQTCTCVGNWHYDVRAKYKSAKRIIDMLVDIVSRNGNLLLNFPLRCDGTLDAEEMKILAEITQWTQVNGEAIYGTRPWKIFGGGPTVQPHDPKQKYTETTRVDLTAADVRFTSKGKALYAFFMGWPEHGRVTIPQLGTGQPHAKGKISQVKLLGYGGRVSWSVDRAGLHVQLPPAPPCKHACALKIFGLEV